MKKAKRLVALMLALVMAVPQTLVYAEEEPQAETQTEIQTGWVQEGSATYYLDANGAKVTGWRMIDGQKYYFSPARNGAMAKGLYKIGKKRYFFKASGALTTGGWLTIRSNNRRYYFKPDGSAVSGTVAIGGKYYHFNPSTNIMHTGWRTNNNHLYYHGTNGVRRTGFQTIDGKRYYFNSQYGYMYTKWKTIDGKRYYFGTDGVMRTGLQKIGNATYIFQTDGSLIKSQAVYKYDGNFYRIDANGLATQFVRTVDVLACRRLEACGYDLRRAFNYAASIPYRVTPQTIPAGYSQAQYYGEYGLKNGYGDCYVMACIFYSMAHILGYRVRFIKGGVPSRSGYVSTHGWVEIEYTKGIWSVCDPNFTYNTKRSGYMIYYGMPGTWRYINNRRVDQNYKE